MVEKYMKVDLTDSTSDEMKALSNLLDPVRLSIFMDRLKSTSEKSSLDEIVQDLLEGR